MKQPLHRLKSVAGSILLALALSSCGGGGSNDPTNANQDDNGLTDNPAGSINSITLTADDGRNYALTNPIPAGGESLNPMVSSFVGEYKVRYEVHAEYIARNPELLGEICQPKIGVAYLFESGGIDLRVYVPELDLIIEGTSRLEDYADAFDLIYLTHDEKEGETFYAGGFYIEDDYENDRYVFVRSQYTSIKYPAFGEDADCAGRYVLYREL